MRKLFAILLIVLLPLRSWTADHMASAPTDFAPTAVVSDSHMPPDCAMSEAMSGDATAASTPLHQGCHFCQLCMPLAALHTPAMYFALPTPWTAVLPHAVTFASAALKQQTKPPIA